MPSTSAPAKPTTASSPVKSLHLAEIEAENISAADGVDATVSAVRHAVASGLAIFSDEQVDDEVEGNDRASMDRKASMILSAMDAAGEDRDDDPYTAERREPAIERVAFRAAAELKLFADPEGAEPWVIYLRDVEARAAGFICADRLPLGYGGTIKFQGPDGEPVEVDVTLVRCRVCYSGWFEGALYFHRNQPGLLAKATQTRPESD